MFERHRHRYNPTEKEHRKSPLNSFRKICNQNEKKKITHLTYLHVGNLILFPTIFLHLILLEVKPCSHISIIITLKQKPNHQVNNSWMHLLLLHYLYNTIFDSHYLYVNISNTTFCTQCSSITCTFVPNKIHDDTGARENIA